MKRRADYLQTLAEEEEARALAAIRDGDASVANEALQRAQRLRRIAYLRAAAAAYQGDPALNPEHDLPATQEQAGQ
jgi:phage shock protein A